MVYTPFSSFMVYVEILKIVVKVDGASTQVATEQGSVGGKDRRDIDMTLATKGDGETCLPFVEVCDYCSR